MENASLHNFDNAAFVNFPNLNPVMSIIYLNTSLCSFQARTSCTTLVMGFGTGGTAFADPNNNVPVTGFKIDMGVVYGMNIDNL